ncbi:alpha/beta fold hydrolase [Burkholderia glumae]
MNDRPPLDVVALAEPGAAARAASSAVWLDAAELHALRLAAQGVPAPGQAAAVTRLHDALARVDGARPVIVLDDPVLRDTRAFDAIAQTLAAALGADGSALEQACIVVLGDPLADAADERGAAAASALDTLTDAVADMLFEVRRRADGYFENQALPLPGDASAGTDLLTAEAVRAWLAADADAGVHVLRGDLRITWHALAGAAAQAIGVDTRPASAGSGTDALAELLGANLLHAMHRLGCAGEAPQRAEGVPPRRLRCAPFDWRSRVAARVALHAAAHASRTAPRLAELPAARRITTGTGHAFLHTGRGPRALLLVNAFGIPNDVWHDFAAALAPEVAVYLLDALHEQSADTGLTRLYYTEPEAPSRYADAVAELLDLEGLASIHVASWCGGARYVLALARALPGHIASLSLIAPSFAGAQDYDGADSAYENNLNTMCSLVARMPKAAESMAKSMLAMLDKRDKDEARSGGHASMLAQADAVTRHWLHAPFVTPSNMVDYSRQLLNFRAHRIEAQRDDTLAGLPALLVTGQYDEMTCATRAHAIGDALLRPLRIELRGGSHHMIHQNAALLAQLVGGFIADPALAAGALPHPRLCMAAPPAGEEMESGEL